MKAAFAAIKPGMRDTEVAAAAVHYSQVHGSENGIYLCASGSIEIGEVIKFGQRHMQNRTIKKGDTLALLVEDSGPGGMYTELGRSCVLGKVPQHLADRAGTHGKPPGEGVRRHGVRILGNLINRLQIIFFRGTRLTDLHTLALPDRRQGSRRGDCTTVYLGRLLQSIWKLSMVNMPNPPFPVRKVADAFPTASHRREGVHSSLRLPKSRVGTAGGSK